MLPLKFSNKSNWFVFKLFPPVFFPIDGRRNPIAFVETLVKYVIYFSNANDSTR